MKFLKIFTFCIAIILCKVNYGQINSFKSSNDTLIIQTKKAKGNGMFHQMTYNINFKDTAEKYYIDTTLHYEYPLVFPKNISNIKRAWIIIDPIRLKSIDIRDNSISFMCGQIGKDTIFIVDEDNNKDFRNDSIRIVHDFDWNKPRKFIKINYKIFNEIEMVDDSTWINIRYSDNQFSYNLSHHYESNFLIDNLQFQIGIIDSYYGFCFMDPIIALIGQNGINKDTLLDKEQLKKDEYVKLNYFYYRLDTVSIDGKYVTLIKEKNFNSKIGTQVGMIAPNFNCQSMNGDSIHLKDYKGKYLLIANVSACYSQISSYKCYKWLIDAYYDKLEILCLDRSQNILKNNIKELNLKGKFVNVDDNKVMAKYRPDYCSRTCFLINPDGRIIDKFEIFDWKSNLAQTFGNKR